MDWNDKLNELRRQRQTRSRSRSIVETWERIDTESELTIKEKLERLINLTARGRKSSPVQSSLDERPAPAKEPFRVIENSYPLQAFYGQISIGLGLGIPGKILALFGRDGAFEPLDLSSSVFLDLETTGLAGGTGTVPFLVGLGYYRNEKFNVSQFFLSDLAEEPAFIEELEGFFKAMDFRSLVTYNGKAFDIPILETRFALNRQPFPLAGRPHLDFLYSARILWRERYESCRLFDLAQRLVRAPRDEDIPGIEIPLRYFQYLRTADFSLIEPIIYHNQEDLLSLMAVVASGAVLVERNQSEYERYEADASELYGVSRLFETAGEIEQAMAILERTASGLMDSDLNRRVQIRLTKYLKNSQRWEKALCLWKDNAGRGDIFSLRELAKFYEHRARDYETALIFSEQGLELSRGRADADEYDFVKRIDRLKDKIRRKTAKAK